MRLEEDHAKQQRPSAARSEPINKQNLKTKEASRVTVSLFYFLTGRELLYNIVLVSAIYERESAIGIHRVAKSRT